MKKKYFTEKNNLGKEPLLANAVNYSTQSIIITDENDKIIEVNKGTLDLFGFSKKKLIGSSFFMLCAEKRPYMVAARITEESKHKGFYKGEMKSRKKDGSVIFADVLLTRVSDKKGKVICNIIYLADITERKIVENELKQRNKELLNMYSASTYLQMTLNINETYEIAINTFLSLGFDRVRIYLYDENEHILIGKKASDINDFDFSKITVEVNSSNPKVFECVTRRMPVIKVTSHDSIYKKALKKDDVKESASLPLITHDKVLGVISLDNKYSKIPILQTNLSSLMTFANQVAVAIENALLYKKNMDKINNLSAMYDISKTISSSLDRDTVLNQIVIKIVKLMKADICAILLLDHTKKILVPRSVYDISGEFQKSDVGFINKCICGKAIASKKQQYSNDVKKSCIGKCFTTHGDLGSLFITPLILEDSVIGTINIFTRKIKKYSHEEMDLLKALANHAAIAINNSRLYSRIKDDREKLEALLDISKGITSTLNIDKLLQLITDKVVEFTKADCGFLMLIKDNYLDIKYHKGYTDESVEKIKIKVGQGISGWVAQHGIPQIIGDVSKDKRYISAIDSIKSEATIPLLIKNKIIGVLNLESKNLDNFRRYSKSLEVLTNNIAIAIENARLYDEVNSFNETLKDEIMIATKELRRKNIELQKLDKMKSDFVSSVSHELRTPLTSIKGYTKLLFMGRLGALTNEQKESLKVITDEAERLTQMINDVLDLARLESGKLKFKLEKVDIPKLAHGIYTTMYMMAKEKGIELSFNSMPNIPLIRASNDLIKQAIMNLVGNAIKFTDKGKVQVSIAKDNEFIKISVKDTGRGIAKEALPKIFDKFYQVDSSITRQHGGTGLGLPIVKQIIEAHKGKVNVFSKLGKGSEFIISLPIKRQNLNNQE